MAELRTERLVLRQWRSTDHEPFAALNADPVVMEHFPSPLDRAASDALIAREQARIDERGWGLWAVEVVATGRFVGFVGLAEEDFGFDWTPAVEIGWRLARAAWGHGYATEAAAAVLAFAFEELGLAELVSFTATTNAPSQAVMQRIGLRPHPASPFDHPRLDPGHRLEEHVLYHLTADDWESTTS
ncbi:MAG: GNAT family N-acetyltransferase [Actinomycetota bacterium]